MIFYFTGTGNSLFAAKALAADGERVISMIDAMRQGELRYALADGEPLGFVFPVYFYTVSDPVLNFIRRLTVENASYVYAVIPCGASIGPAGALLKKELAQRGLALQRVDPLVVPDGALIFYDIDTPEKLSQTLEAATVNLRAIKQAVGQRQPSRISGSVAAAKAGLAAYHLCQSTKKFCADDKCIRCGKCASVCPAEAIRLVDGRPVWEKSKCFKCTGCINRCPVGAIQYGKKTAKRGRYVNPELK